MPFLIDFKLFLSFCEQVPFLTIFKPCTWFLNYLLLIPFFFSTDTIHNLNISAIYTVKRLTWDMEIFIIEPLQNKIQWKEDCDTTA